VPEDELALCTFAYVENCAHAIALALDHPDASAGQIYNVGDDEVLTVRQVVETIGRALKWEGEVVSLPWELARPARPMIMQPLTTHRVFDTSKLRAELGYRDAVAAEEALGRTAHWPVANPAAPGGPEEAILEDFLTTRQRTVSSRPGAS
jgi:nucleoside-diphosphate-sugar epimerase